MIETLMALGYEDVVLDIGGELTFIEDVQFEFVGGGTAVNSL